MTNEFGHWFAESDDGACTGILHQRRTRQTLDHAKMAQCLVTLKESRTYKDTRNDAA